MFERIELGINYFLLAELCIRRWIFLVHVVSRKVFEITLAVDRLLNTSYTLRNVLYTMAEGSSENLNTSIRELLAQVRDQKRHINSIQEEVRAIRLLCLHM